MTDSKTLGVGSNDPYLSGVTPDRPDMAHRAIEGRMVAVSARSHDARGLSLIPQRTRCLRRYDIHELIVTDESGQGSGDTVDRVAYLGFFEITSGGLLIQGDELLIADQMIGSVIGFDETHLPNHLNIVVSAAQRESGRASGLTLNDPVIFQPVWNN
ncbi:DUF6917 domain-containing protein [Pelagibius sp.]|uniref:DUF6917 domain-containing protein n=1 Tax=Pelagibius sp. TaxID=1931238 RepID=UPI003BAF22A4